MVNALDSFSQAEDIPVFSSLSTVVQSYHNGSVDNFRVVAGSSGIITHYTTNAQVCSDLDLNSFTGEEFFKCIQKVVKYYVDKNNQKLKCWLH